MNKNQIKKKKKKKKPHDVYILFNKRVTELIGSKKIKSKLKNLNSKSWT